MAYGKVILERDLGGYKEIKEAPIGFSWTMLFFGSLVPLYRGDYKWAIITFLAALITYGFSWFVFPFFYNKLYLKDLVKQGYKIKAVEGATVDQVRAYIGMEVETVDSKP